MPPAPARRPPSRPTRATRQGLARTPLDNHHEPVDPSTYSITDELAERILELAQVNKELETFSYTVSHDLRTPLTIIENYVHVLNKSHRGELSPEAAKAMDGIHSAVQRMGTLIQNILQLSRVMRLPLRRERTDLAAMARQILAELAERDPERHVTVKAPAHIWVMADPALLRIVLANLLGNAWKFTGRKTKATITIGQAMEDGVPSFFVQDNGAGFDMKEVGRLFQLFERLHTPSDYAGTGIGLATVARAVQRHDGTAWAKASPGRGATFSFTLGEAGVPDTPRGKGASA